MAYDSRPVDSAESLDSLGDSLCRAIAANRFDEADELSDRCVALHALDTHDTIMAILRRAHRLAMMQRSFIAARLANLQRANRYLTP